MRTAMTAIPTAVIVEHAHSTRMWGFTRDVLPAPQVPEDPEERASAIAVFATSFPAIMQVVATSKHAGEACDNDAEFGFALDLILAGAQRLHERDWTPTMPVQTGLHGHSHR